MRILPLLIPVITFSGSLLGSMPVSAGTTYLVYGTYTQIGGAKPQISVYSAPNLQIIPMESVEQCEAAATQIHKDIYKPVWGFDGRWTCIEGK